MVGLAELTPSRSSVWRVYVWPKCLQLPVEHGASRTCSCRSGGQPHAHAAPCCPGSGRAKAGTEALAQGLFARHLLTGLYVELSSRAGPRHLSLRYCGACHPQAMEASVPGRLWACLRAVAEGPLGWWVMGWQ